jgi:hypothetical protein
VTFGHGNPVSASIVALVAYVIKNGVFLMDVFLVIL